MYIGAAHSSTIAWGTLRRKGRFEDIGLLSGTVLLSA
jgi:hypothetical protein